MAYPDLPKNRLIIDGVDLSETYGLVLLDGYTLSPPKPKYNYVDIPGRNGKLDLTEVLTGDICYGNRIQKFSFKIVGLQDFEKVKTELSNRFHGRSFDYKLSMDPMYTYHGRITVDSYKHSRYSEIIVGDIEITIEADPYKFKDDVTASFNTSSGALAILQSGRLPVIPIIEVSDSTIVMFNDRRWLVDKGSYRFNDMLFSMGANEVFLMSAKAKSHMTYGEMKKYSYEDVKNTKRIYQWYEGIYKSYLKETKFIPKSSVSGVLEYEVLFEDDTTTAYSLDLGDISLQVLPEGSDYITTDSDNKAYVYKHIYADVDGVLGYNKIANITVIDFPTPYSSTSKIKNVSINKPGDITYSAEVNMEELTISSIPYSDYMDSGKTPMTYGEMSKYRNSNLSATTSYKPYTENQEMAYIKYPWGDL